MKDSNGWLSYGLEELKVVLSAEKDSVLAHAEKHYGRAGLLGSLVPYYQYGKVVEEIGELLQAIGQGNYANGRAYPEVRGSVESEAADVIIAAYVYCCVTDCADGNIPLEVLPRLSAEETADFFLSALRTKDVPIVISAAASIIAYRNCSPASAVRERIEFNKSRKDK